MTGQEGTPNGESTGGHDEGGACGCCRPTPAPACEPCSKHHCGHHHDGPAKRPTHQCGCCGPSGDHGPTCCHGGGPGPGGGGGCPPPTAPPPPGTADVPQTDPPYRPGHAETPPWAQGRPGAGTPAELPWFRGKIREIQRKGPVFGPRKDEFLPYLLIRNSAADRGARPYTDVFWESPDIFVVRDQPAETAPAYPVGLGGTAHASAPNTLYAHVWNLGKAPAYGVRVEFWWFDPSLGISRPSGHLIGTAQVDLGDRFTRFDDWREEGPPTGRWLTRGCHAIVKCPTTWVPAFVNGGHECLVVRIGDTVFDPVAVGQFSPALDRHVGQRNIAVVPASSPADLTLPLDLGWNPSPGEALVEISADPPGAMGWLQLYAGSRSPGYRTPAVPVVAGLTTPFPRGVQTPTVKDLPPGHREAVLRPRETFHRGCDPLAIGAHASIQEIGPDEAQVLRVRQRIDGVLVGGYTIVLVGRR